MPSGWMSPNPFTAADVFAHTTSTQGPSKSLQLATEKKTKNALDFSIPQAFVTITVGDDPSTQSFVIHKSLICHYSDFFERAFTNTSFLEGATQKMILEDIDSKTFGLIVHWLYMQNLKDREREGGPSLISLAKVWVLADRFLIPNLYNMAISKFRAALLSLEDGEQFIPVVNFAYGGDMEKDNPLQKLLVETFAYTNKKDYKEDWLNRMEEFPTAFATDVLRVFSAFHDNRPAKFHGRLSSAVEFYIKVKDDEINDEEIGVSGWV